MTQPTDPDLNKCCAARPSPGPPGRCTWRWWQPSLKPAGRPRSELEHIARSIGSGPAAVLAELTGRDVIAFGTDGEIRAAGGSTLWLSGQRSLIAPSCWSRPAWLCQAPGD